MRFEPLWDNEERTIARITFRGNWTRDDFNTSFAAAVNMIRRDKQSDRVILILDFSESTAAFTRILSACRYAYASDMPGVNLVIATGGALNHLSLNLFARGKQSRQSVQFASSLEESLQAARLSLAT